jgi:Xaa-Pro aminopeptidase
MTAAVAASPPPELVAAQRTTIEITDAVLGRVSPGVSEIELARCADRLARQRGATGVWTPIAVGAGVGALVCHPDHPPTERRVSADDIVFLDLTPDFGGWPGDVTRSVVVGSDSARRQVAADALRIEQALIAACRPGMPAAELFSIAAELLSREGYELLDLLGNVGHDLGPAGRVTGFIDATNGAPMWGAWAIEPHIGRDGFGAKFEDVVWLGSDGVIVVGRA